MQTVSVIILNYNAGDMLLECVKRVFDSTIPTRCIVVDNASQDNSIEELEKQYAVSNDNLLIIKNTKNYGFSKGCNTGLPHANTDFILFLNPDCFIEKDTIERMLQEMEKYPNAGIASCLIRNMDGTEQRGCRRHFPTPRTALMRITGLYKIFRNHKWLSGFDLTDTALPTTTIDMDGISGAFMLVRSTALKEVGALDEGYTLHCEDLDWCMRFHQTGWRVLFVPHITIHHIKSACSRNNPIFVTWHKHKGMLRFYYKFYNKKYPKLIMWLISAAVWMRCFLMIILETIKKLQRKPKLSLNLKA